MRGGERLEEIRSLLRRWCIYGMRFGGVLRVKVVILVLLLVLPFSVSSQVILDPPVTIRLKNVDVVIQTRLYSSVDMLVGENSFTINGTSLVVESPEIGRAHV